MDDNGGAELVQRREEGVKTLMNDRIIAFTGKEFASHAEYWRRKISLLNDPFRLKIGGAAPETDSDMQTSSFVLEPSVQTVLSKLTQDRDLETFIILLAGWYILFFKYSGESESLVASPPLNRESVPSEASPVPLIENFSADETVKDLIIKVNQTVTQAYNYQDFPREVIISKEHLPQHLLGSNVFISFEGIHYPADPPPDCDLIIRICSDLRGFKNLEGLPADSKAIRIRLDYTPGLFGTPDIESFVQNLTGHYQNIIQAFKDVNTRIRDIDILGKSERYRILSEFNDTRCPFPEDKSIPGLFEAQVAKTPDAPALIFEDRELSYKELNREADLVADYLIRQAKIETGAIVGVMIGRSEWLVICLLGILKSGGVYLPIDPDSPQERILYMLEDSQCSVLITEDTYLETARSSSVDRIIQIPLFAESDSESNLRPAPCALRPDSLAYLIYTSGSTGKPKGSLVHHQGPVNMSLDQIRSFGITQSDRSLQFASPAFDASIYEIFMALFAGAAVVVVSREKINDPEKFAAYLTEKQVTVVTLPPVYLNTLDRNSLKTLKTIITAGEAAIVDDALFYSRHKQYINAYGPTEASVCISFHRVNPDRAYPESIPIGKPISNTSLFILDKFMKPLPVGVPGEICVSGAGVGRGYLHRPDLTAEKFIPHPFKDDPLASELHLGNGKLYRTGDIGKWLPDGNIVFSGRTDDQVKIRGYRIELGEIESALESVPGIGEAVVLAKQEDSGEKILVAYFVRAVADRAQAYDLSPESLRGLLKQRLPDYMIPSYFAELEKFPLTTSGKIDKRNLPDYKESEASSRTVYEAPRNDLEAKIAEIWELIMGRKAGIHDDYFAVGGDSIKAIQIVSRLHQEHLKLQVKDIFQHPTIAELAEIVVPIAYEEKDQGMVSGTVPLTPIQEWFFKTCRRAPHHFNQSEMLHSKERLQEDGLRAVFEKIQEHHDALRMRYRFSENDPPRSQAGAWERERGDSQAPAWERERGDSQAPAWERKIVQENCGKDYLLSFETIDLRDAADPLAKMAAHAESVQSGITLDSGPLMNAILYRLDDGDRLLIIIHHLVIDSVSWRFLLEDLTLGYSQFLAGEPIRFPAKTDSYKTWSRFLRDYCVSQELLREKVFWAALESASPESLPADGQSVSDPLCFGGTHTLNAEFSDSETDNLLSNVNHAYNTNISDIFLTALARALKGWHGVNKTLIALEGHGRDWDIQDTELNARIPDISRTTGWFTSLYPLLLELPDSEDLGYQIRYVKESLRKIPNKGIGYGILKYLTPAELKQELSFDTRPQIAFNYLGQFDKDPAGRFSLAREDAGNAVSPDSELIHEISVSALVIEGRLKIWLTWHPALFKLGAMEKLLRDFGQELRHIIAHCMNAEDTELSPSDIDYDGLDIEELDAVLENL
jgi:amino acid adenylation domain-containing protein/non-ribosomal peptide synthase protein (TIGR01720 family)